MFAMIPGYYEGKGPPFPSRMGAPGQTIYRSLEDDPFPGLLPALLLVLGALFGGLRALLASPLRSTLTVGLPEVWRKRANLAAQPNRGMATAAGLLRLICLVAAVVLLLRTVEELKPVHRWGLLLACALLAGFLIEGLPALVLRGRAQRLVLLCLPLVRVGAFLLMPLIRAIQHLLRLIGTAENHQRTRRLASELTEIAQEHGRTDRLGPAERKMIGRLLELPDTDAAEVMTPRTGITAVEAAGTVAEALAVAAEEGHSRIPIFEGDLDHIVGVFHIKDVLAAPTHSDDLGSQPVRNFMREAYFVPETVRVPNLLDDMRRRRAHLAVVVDEYGGNAGVVTIEDLLEEIVGEIEDEHDTTEDQPKVHSSGPQEIIADGGVSIQLLNEDFAANLPEDESYETLAGLIFERLGHIPETGESLPVDQITLEVLEADDRRVRRVRLLRAQINTESDAA
jgi:magnesium and cobalt exporter, CNNM family